MDKELSYEDEQLQVILMKEMKESQLQEERKLKESQDIEYMKSLLKDETDDSSDDNVKEFEEVSIHNSVVFLENTTLRTRVKREYYPKLKVQLEKSPHSDLGSTTWVVSIKIDIKDGIQVNQNKQISISIK